MNRIHIICCYFILLATFATNAQTIQNSSSYVSELDQSLTIKKIALLPVTDNVNGIYAHPIEDHIKDFLTRNHQYNYVDPKFAGALLTPQELEENPEQVKKISATLTTDAVLCIRANKSTTGLSLHFSLFNKRDGTLLAQQINSDLQIFETTQVQKKSLELLNKILKQIPYDGMVLSRSDTRVTLNVGKLNGVKKDQVVTAILLINLTRHPKFNFIISSEKEVLGKIRLTKVEETLSFGQIITEKERNTIKKDTKVSGIDFVAYQEENSISTPAASDSSKQLIFGDKPQEWKPAPAPSFGKVGAMLGLGTLTYKSQLRTAGSLEASSSLFPSIKVLGELWITPRLIMNFELQQGILSSDNPLSGSAPSELSLNVSSYYLTAGYNFMLHNDFFGPSIQVVFGYSSYSMFVDPSSPLALTTTKYSGFLAGLRGTVPLTDDRIWNLGASLDIFLSNNINEDPQSSGSSSDNTINRFSFFGFYQLNTKVRIKSAVEFSFYSSNFTGDGSRTDDAVSSSQKISNLTAGLEYLF